MIALKAFKSNLNYGISSAVFANVVTVGAESDTGITALSVTLNNVGYRPIQMMLIPEYNRSGYAEGSATGDTSSVVSSGDNGQQVRFYQGSTNIVSFDVTDAGASNAGFNLPPGSFSITFFPSTTGNLTFSVKSYSGGTATISYGNVALFVMEL